MLPQLIEVVARKMMHEVTRPRPCVRMALTRGHEQVPVCGVWADTFTVCCEPVHLTHQSREENQILLLECCTYIARWKSGSRRFRPICGAWYLMQGYVLYRGAGGPYSLHDVPHACVHGASAVCGDSRY
jgi:hypothetical protein